MSEIDSRRISVLMPTHNRADILPICLESFLELKIPDGYSVEMIVVVNACADDTTNVLDEWMPRMPFPARYVVDSVAGSSHARNTAIEESGGAILAFVDDDVLVSNHWLQGLIDVFSSTDADFVGGPVRLWWHAVQRPQWFPEKFDSLLAAKDHGDKIIQLHQPFAVITINTAYKRSLVDEIGGFRLDLERRGKGTGSFEDVEFNQRALDAGFRLYYAPDAPVKHWVEPSRMSFSAMTRMLYYVGQARAFAKPKLDFVTLFRSIAGNIFLLSVHLPAELLARVRRSGATAFSHRRMWSLGLGGIVGMTKRLIGRQSGY